MRRWNGWGETEIDYPVPESARGYLYELIGPSERIPDAPLEATLEQVPASRLPDHPACTTEPLERLKHARGHSLPDWVALRHGQIGVFPDGVAYPDRSQDVTDILAFAQQKGICVIPYGGGTSVLGHINPLQLDRPVLTMDMQRMNRLLSIDEKDWLAEFEAGASGPQIEASLSDHGYTLGHFPQSFEFSTLGGWIATRSTGRQSHLYGAIENLFLGGHLESYSGALDLPPFPSSAAGPDLRQFILGSEGRLGILTRAFLRVTPKPVTERYAAAFFPNWDFGLEALRRAAQDSLPVAMLRLSDAVETETTLVLSGKKRLVALAHNLLKVSGYGAGRCLLVYMIAGDYRRANIIETHLNDIIAEFRGLRAGSFIGKAWKKGEYRYPYLRNSMWELGYGLDSIESATTWSKISTLAQAVQNSIRTAMEARNLKALAFTHVSHIYPTGANVYTTLIFPRSPDPAETLERWRAIKTAASLAILEEGGTISHQHGVGVDHAPYLEREISKAGMALLASVHSCMDPLDLLNPGKLV